MEELTALWSEDSETPCAERGFVFLRGQLAGSKPLPQFRLGYREVVTRPVMGVITRHSEEPYVNSTSTVLWEVPGVTRAAYPIAGLASAERTARYFFYGAKRSEKNMTRPDRSLPRRQAPPLFFGVSQKKRPDERKAPRLSRSNPGWAGESR